MSEAEQRHRLRTTFETIAQAYDTARPLYPPELFDDLALLASLRAGDRIVEIGCGTGQATRPLAERGFALVCVELGAQLAAIARTNLAAFPNVKIVNAAFEAWEPEDEPFDAIVAFTAFHWVDPEARYQKSARLLRRGGKLAVVETQHVLEEGGDSFWVDVQEDYDAISPSDDNRPPPPPDAVGDLCSEIEGSGRFRNAQVRRRLWHVTYSSDDYIAVLDTYSGHRSMPNEDRERLYQRIARRIEQQPGRQVTKTYLATLNVAERI